MSAVLDFPTHTQPEVVKDLPKWCERTEVQLKINRDVSFDEWSGLIARLNKTRKGHQWWLGDGLIEGEGRFGEDYAQIFEPDEVAQEEEDPNAETLRSYQWVAQRIPPVHRCTTVPWSLHRDVAAMEAEDRDYWLGVAAAKKLSRRQLQKAIKATKEPKAAIKLSLELQKLHDDAVRAEIDGRIAAVRGWTEPVDPVLSTLYHRIVEELEWQRDRTIETDCAAIMKMFLGEGGTEGVYTADQHDISAWLYARGLVIGEQDLTERLELLAGNPEKKITGLKMLSIQSREGSRGPEQRGAIPTVYATDGGYLSDLDDFSRLPAAERAVALHQNWIARLTRYAPELAITYLTDQTSEPGFPRPSGVPV